MDREIMAEIKKLSDRVQYLEDQLVKQRRENANLMEELDNTRNSAISSSFVGAVDKKFSEIMQTEEKIQMTVADVSDEAKKQYSKYEQTAQNISMEVSAVYEEPEILWGDTPKDNDDKNKLYAYYKADTTGDVEHEGAKYSFVCYYRYNAISKKWEKTSADSIASQFVQTVDGFKLKGDVQINGNTYQNGHIYVTGEGAEKGSAIYVCNGDIDEITGFISFDTTGSGDNEAKNRMLIAAEMGNALKILTYATSAGQKSENISIGAGMWRGPNNTNEYSGYGYVYISSPIVFTHFGGKNDNLYDVVFQDGCEVDFSNAKVSGLYAVFE